MRKCILVLLGVLFLAIFPAACGGGAEESADGGDSEVDQDADAASDPDQLSLEIAENYIACMEELEAMVQDKPDPQDLKPMLQDLTDRYIGIFVEIGYEVDEYDSTTIDDIGIGVMSELYGRDIDWMSEASSYYHPIDPEISSMIGELNIITQYAFFDLLRRQRPSEAERLGI